jgi:hypothetical protein
MHTERERERNRERERERERKRYTDGSTKSLSIINWITDNW